MNLLSDRLAFIYREHPELEGERGQMGLVRASGASKSVVNQWLNDKIKSIDIRYALQIEAALGYSHIWLMTGFGEPQVKPGLRAVLPEPPKAERPRMTLATEDELDLLDLYRLSTERGQVAIRTTAQNTTKRSADEILSDKR